MYGGLPQKYGTNLVPDGVGWRLWDVVVLRLRVLVYTLLTTLTWTSSNPRGCERDMAAQDEKGGCNPRPGLAFAALCIAPCRCLLLQDLSHSCSRGIRRRGIVEDMC
jgi:hypothetical protein